MFEKDIKSISDFSLNKLKKLGGYFTLEQIMSAKLHPAIIRYIEAEIDFLIYQDRKKILHNSAFDYSNPEIQNHFNEINSEIKRNKTISFEDAKNLIVQAVSFTANYVVRPKWSLTKFIFNQDNLKSVEEIKLSLNYLYYYDYLRNVLNAFIDKKRTLNISLVDFEVTLNKIDKELFNQHTKNLVDNALDSIADFFNMGVDIKTTVSSNAVEILLKEKDLIDYLFRLRRSVPVSNKSQYKISEIKNIIYSTTTVEKPEIEREIETELLNENLYEQENVQEQNIIEKDKIEPTETDTVQADDKKEELKEQNPFNFPQQEINSDTEYPVNKTIVGKIEEEAPGTDDDTADENFDELIDEDVLSELTSDEDFLQEFDSQLKALEEESKLLKLENPDVLEEEILANDLLTDISDENINVDTESISEVNGLEFNYDEVEDNSDIKQNDLFPPESEEESSIDLVEEDQQEEREIKEPEITEISEPEIPQRGKDVFSYLSNKEIDKIVSYVFNEDRDDFVTTMEKVSECRTYSEATEILKSVFFSYRVNPYTKDAVTLTNAVSNYFKQA